jgi:hypothetical protein
MRVLKWLQWLDLPPDSPTLSTPEFREFLEACFPPLRNSDGSWKRSRATRHGELDERLAAILHEQQVATPVFMDVGMANGISTLETIRCLERDGLRVQTIATDRNLEAYVVQLHPHLDALVESHGHILMCEWHGCRFSPHCDRWDYFTGRLLLKWGVTAWARRRLARLGLPLISRPAAIGDEACPVEGPFVLVTPELKGRPDVVVRTDDILEPPPADLAGAADVVRIVNVLRPDYFSAGQLRQVAANLRQRCRDGGLLIVGRNRMQQGVRPRWAASLLQAEPGGGFRLLERLGNGSEVEAYFVPPGKGTALGHQPASATAAGGHNHTISRSGE